MVAGLIIQGMVYTIEPLYQVTIKLNNKIVENAEATQKK